MFELDHLAVSAASLPEGVEFIEDLFGVALAPGGDHALMGTHNRLLSLGSDIYLEVIAINPVADHPGRSRWFDLDHFAGKPRITNWIARVDNFSAARDRGPAGIGEELSLSRGDLNWRMLVPDDGILPYGGAYPALISWDGTAHPTARLPDRGLRVEEVRIGHPDADEISALLPDEFDRSLVRFETRPEFVIEADIRTPRGICALT